MASGGVTPAAFCALRELMRGLFARINPAGVRAMTTTSHVDVPTWLLDGTWIMTEAGLRGECRGAVMSVMIPGVLLSDNPPTFSVQVSGPGGDVIVMVAGLTTSVQVTLPW